MPGVEELEEWAFRSCPALSHVECPKLGIIGTGAFGCCGSLSGINLPSARIVEGYAFSRCHELLNVTFGPLLESVRESALEICSSLELITIPLKNDLFPYDDTFQECDNLRHINIVEEGVLNDTVAALFLEDWRHDMIEEIDSINQDLPDASAGVVDDEEEDDDWDGEKTIVLRSWISLVLSKIIRYKAQHRGLFNAAEDSLRQLGLPDDVVRNNVLPFLELPAHVFHGEDNTVAVDPDLAELELPRE